LRENAKSGPLTPRPAASGVCPALFGVRPVVVRLTKLHAKGYVSDPKSKAKPVVVTVKGVQRSRELSEKNFGKKEPDVRQR
jgi:hypothetical protein